MLVGGRWRSGLVAAAVALSASYARADGGRARAEGLVAKGDAQMKLGDAAGAEVLYQDAVSADGTHAVATMRLAHALGQTGNESQAVALLEGLVAGGRGPNGAHRALGEILAGRGEWRRAAAELAAHLAVEKTDVRARLELARVHRQRAVAGDAAARGEALVQYEQVVKEAGEDVALRHVAEEEAIGLRYGDAGRSFGEGRRAFANGEIRVAQRKLEAAVAAHPDLEAAQDLLGWVYASPELGRPGDAREAWERAPSRKEAQLALAMAYRADGELALAEATLGRAIALDPSYQEAWLHLGAVHAEQGDYGLAKRAFGQAMLVGPRSPAGRRAAARSLVLAGRSDWGSTEGTSDPASEVAAGQKVTDALLSRHGVVEDPRLEQRLERIWDRLLAASDRGGIPHRLVLVNWDAVIAFSAPGGRVFVCKGLVDLIRRQLGDRDDLYAAVLAHELSHVMLWHAPEGLAAIQAVLDDPRRAAELDRALVRIATGMPPDAELEADRAGVLTMHRAGYDARHGLELVAVLGRLRGEVPPGASELGPTEREARLIEFLVEMRGRVGALDRGNDALAAGDPAGAARHYESFLTLLPDSASGHFSLALAWHRRATSSLGPAKYKRTTDLPDRVSARSTTLPATGGGTPIDARVARLRLREAAAEYRTALRLDPFSIAARLSYGALLLDLSQPAAAEKVLEAATRRAPRSSAAWNDLGVARAAGGDREGAVVALEKAAQLDPKLADPWFNLAVVHADDGDKGKTLASVDEYLRRDGSSGWAAQIRDRRERWEKQSPKKARKPTKASKQKRVRHEKRRKR